MADRTGQRFGNYRLIRLLGRGGFAEVYLGEHAHLQTQAAIKILQDTLTADARTKFLNEARTNARLQHPHIIPVLDFNIEGTIPYLVMEYAPHGTLRQRHPQGLRLSPDVILPYIKQVADALLYVHHQNLVHQDVKPANMLLGQHDQVLLSDFGIAIPRQSPPGGYSGLGTVTYMAPEQIQHHASAASDQYALGIVAYEWLCGTCPFTGSTKEEIIDKQLHMDPPSLRTSITTLSPAIEQVLFTALSKDPAQRYASVWDFALAFEAACMSGNFLPPNLSTTLTLSPQLSSSTTLTPHNASAASPGNLAHTMPASHAVRQEQHSPKLPAANISARLQTTLPARTGVIGTTSTVYQGHQYSVRTVAWSPDGTHLASGSDDSHIHIWEMTAKTGAYINSDHYDYIWSLHWSPDGKHLAASSAAQLITILDASNGKTIHSYKRHEGNAIGLGMACALAWSPDGARIASGGADHVLHLWKADSGKTLLTCQGHTDDIHALAWSPDGQHLASASHDATVRIWDGNTGATLLIYSHHTKRVTALAWSPDSRRIASASDDMTAQIWDVATGERLHTLTHSRRVRAIAWSPDGKFIATGGRDTLVHIWNADTGQHLFAYREHTDEINAVAWAPDSTYLASASNDETVRIWHASA